VTRARERGETSDGWTNWTGLYGFSFGAGRLTLGCFRFVDIDFQWTHKAHWIDHMTITGSNTDRVVDVNDDLTRETFFYERALESANECVRKLKDLDVPVRRPDDYYAEMVKSDEHMKRVRSELLHEQQQLEIREERRKAREAKKFGKQVQAEKVKQRTLDKKAQIKSLDKWRKMRQKSGFADDGKAPFDGADDGRRGSKRAARDAKFGFGGRKKVRWFACLIERAFYPLLLLVSFFVSS